ncbi:Rieske 2Fe-2S domain-containing protein [Minwuia sp.]|uniref:aromatic ring-hydroxylating dioxygenase subunit alpha n=1 Tax=Minwuia sp. TaxID=2493630 RepID=UPI003A93D9B1
MPSPDTPYIRNHWYVAGWSSEFGEGFTTATILEQDIVLYRTDGDVVAFQDRCPHRALPLSMGKRIGDAIQCGYHGLTFGPDGGCIRVPGQKSIPPQAWVRRYPTHERHGIVWIWMGEDDLADPADIFDLSQLSDSAWAAVQGDALKFRSNYLNVADNLCDPAHVSFVHPTTLGNASSEDVPVKAKRNGRTVEVSRWIRDGEPIGFFRAYGGFEGHVDRWHYYYLHSPCIAVIDFGSADAALALPPERRSEGVQIFALHFMTPVDATTTIDRWMHIRNTAIDDASAGAKISDLLRIAFAEDKAILEAVQRTELKPSDREPVRVAIDSGANIYRRIIREMLAEETPHAEAAE